MDLGEPALCYINTLSSFQTKQVIYLPILSTLLNVNRFLEINLGEPALCYINTLSSVQTKQVIYSA